MRWLISSVSTQRRVGVKQHADHLAQIPRAQANHSQKSPQSQSLLAFREWTERVIIIIDALWPTQQVGALRFESEQNE